MKNWNKPEVEEIAIKMTAGNAWGNHDKDCPVRKYQDSSLSCTCAQNPVIPVEPPVNPVVPPVIISGNM